MTEQFTKGDRVRVKSDTYAPYNGLAGTVLRKSPHLSTYYVKLDERAMCWVYLRLEELELIAAEEPPAAVAPTISGGEHQPEGRKTPDFVCGTCGGALRQETPILWLCEDCGSAVVDDSAPEDEIDQTPDALEGWPSWTFYPPPVQRFDMDGNLVADEDEAAADHTEGEG